MQAKANQMDLESGGITVAYGRPDLKKIITETVAILPSDQTVGVIASGWT